ncbi:nuclear transport factor 2 family protein [Taklimakanibacter deserti]|uniref:nuclear transport factor 2 family protein n=1 Tax=Taklimakanibacter deserti TaxID=2267839 RepID=UPI000E658DEB
MPHDFSRRNALLLLSTTAALVGKPTDAWAAPDFRPALEAAIDAFFDGWRSGDWSPFLARCADDFTFQFPVGPQRGRRTGTEGKASITAWCRAHAQAGNRITESAVSLRLFDADWAVICDRGNGVIEGQPYTGLHAIFMRAGAAGQIVEMREYFGELPG